VEKPGLIRSANVERAEAGFAASVPDEAAPLIRAAKMSDVSKSRKADSLILTGFEGAPQMESLIDAMLPAEPPPVPSEATVLQARRNAQARLELLEEFGYVTAEQIGEGRSRAGNRHALASGWRRAGRVFTVEYKGRKLFPGFQFDEQGAPRPVIAAVLEALPTDAMSDWEVALWWTSANGWLDSERPVDRLDDTDALVAAAAHLAEPLPL
jgi:hypothetical protein